MSFVSRVYSFVRKSVSLFPFATLFVVLGAGCLLAVPSGAAAASVGLSTCKTNPNRNVVIGGANGCGPEVQVDQDFTGALAFDEIKIEKGGTLSFPAVTRELDSAAIIVGSGGTLEAGTTANPIGKTDPNIRITLKFLGSRPCKSPMTCPGFHKGIEVEPHGSLSLVGWKGVPASSTAGANPNGISWTRLNAAAAKGTTTLTLADDVSNDWQANDWITVATTSYSPFETEFVQIAGAPTKLVGGGSQVTLVQPLAHNHFGHLPPTPSQQCLVSGVMTAVVCGTVAGCNSACTSAPSLLNFNDGAAQNWGVDERAEVGLITRNVKLTAVIPPNDPNSLWWGGETLLHEDAAQAVIQGVEIEKFGKDRLGSYPIHFHKAGDVKNQPTVNANSIHHTYNHCITVHSTQNLTLSNNVCARVIGHIFYEEIGDERNVTFNNNLGLGAMSQWFGIDRTKVPLNGAGIPQDYWEGDNLANDPSNCGQSGGPPCFNYNALNVPDVDDQTAPTHSDCFAPDGNGGLRTVRVLDKFGEKCKPGELYEEPASGFWLINPGTNLTGNAIGGCQGVGVAYWYVPPPDTLEPTFECIQGVPGPCTPVIPPRTPNPTKFTPIGTWRDNHAHACYDGFFGETQFGLHSEQPQPKVGGKVTGKNLIATFDGLTATRNRDRGVWLRPLWSAFKNGRFATNRDDVSLVSSGGLDGNAPGVWALLEDSVLLGISGNNVDRFGPCPKNQDPNFGCVDKNPLANDIMERGYPSPFWNFAGFMIYDGPVRIFHDRFVNFNKDLRAELTPSDQTYFDSFTNYPNASGGPYEGDAALGWFQSNQSSYPTATATRQLIFENTDLRHQIYTDKVNLAAFNDGDQNTSILDEDGTLTGYKSVDSSGNSISQLFPDSLNNLEFNGASNSVDECLAQGAQDDKFEGRPTSLISPANMGTLEFGTLFPRRDLDARPPTDATQFITVTKDNLDYGEHEEEHLHGRNGQGLWEPKVASGFGYTITAAPATDKNRFPQSSGKSGIAKVVDIGLTDVAKPNIAAKPFFTRVGICYTDSNGNHPPAGHFTITKGYKSWGGNGTDTSDPDLQKFFANLDNRFQGQFCINLDDQNANKNIKDNVNGKGCPANGVIPKPSGGCPSDGSIADKDQQGRPACIYPVQCTEGDANCPCPNGSSCGRVQDKATKFHPVSAITDLTNADGTPKDVNGFFYDATNGMLFFYVTQDKPNAFGPSPLGSCIDPNKSMPSPGDPTSNDPSCPDLAHLENYYACPAQGCQDYVVKLDDANYNPGPSTCGLPSGQQWSPSYDPSSIYSLNNKAYEVPIPPNQNQLVYAQNGSVVIRKQPDPQVSAQGFKHSVPTVDPQCPNPTPTP